MSGWRVLLLAATMSLGAAPAFANRYPPPPPPPSHRGHGVPEIDPAGLGTAATLLAGGAFLLGARIKRRRKAESI
jgi:hypothetical protein